MSLFNRRGALVVAHPGHEMRVYAWLKFARPLVFVLTDGSGRSGKSRLPSTSRILEQVEAVSGCIYGRLTDAQIYSAMLNVDVDCFVGLAAELADALMRGR